MRERRLLSPEPAWRLRSREHGREHGRLQSSTPLRTSRSLAGSGTATIADHALDGRRAEPA